MAFAHSTVVYQLPTQALPDQQRRVPGRDKLRGLKNSDIDVRRP